MSQRRQTSSPAGEFGSDSFLDIIANIVGILIILMVIAGVRVSRAPLVDATQPSPVAAAPQVSSLTTSPITTESELPEVATPIVSEAIDEPTPAEPELIEPTVKIIVAPPQELVARAEALQVEIANLQRSLGDAQSQRQSAIISAEQVQQDTARAAADIDRAQQQLDEKQKLLSQLEALVGQTDEQVETLEQNLAELEEEGPPVKTLKHRLTPVSRVVLGEEVHFRLANGRISHVPIAELRDRLFSKLLKQRTQIISAGALSGTVGPIEGYMMNYFVERQSRSAIDEFQLGPGKVVVQATFEPLQELVTEAVDEAMQPDSRFMQKLYSTRYGSTLTFWVYPESFGEYRRFQEYGHQKGFTVAARPWLPGLPISASTEGSSSQGQ